MAVATAPFATREAREQRASIDWSLGGGVGQAIPSSGIASRAFRELAGLSSEEIVRSRRVAALMEIGSSVVHGARARK